MIALVRRLRTAWQVLGKEGHPSIWSLFVENIATASRTLPGGLVRVGTQKFRPSDSLTRHLLLKGIYETGERLAAKQFIRCDIPVIEFGASLGVVSCEVNRRLANAKNHVVVEANPNMLPLLTENRDRNRCAFEILHGAAGIEGDATSFYIGHDTLSSSAVFTTDEAVEVRAVRLKEILEFAWVRSMRARLRHRRGRAQSNSHGDSSLSISRRDFYRRTPPCDQRT